MPENITRIPAARVPLTPTELITREWYRFLYNLYAILGSGSLRYGTFYDTTDQTAAAINTAYAITLNNTDLSSGVYRGTPTSRIYVDRPGAYNFQFSVQLITTNSSDKDVYIWARINGVDVANSATKLTIGGANGHAFVAAWNFVLRMNTGDYFELMWATSDTNVKIDASAATAFCPAIPSVILTVTCNIGE
jgi:hypothetical protein